MYPYTQGYNPDFISFYTRTLLPICILTDKDTYILALNWANP